ncbi:MAG TPA: hypothetical protein VE954_38190, partial [Oligoflexus sp.]|uniref:hypothetical protein n=1 Tax=Oligoflexus sp. TaxID=1971216 RepID=UPI002D763B16
MAARAYVDRFQQLPKVGPELDTRRITKAAFKPYNEVIIFQWENFFQRYVGKRYTESWQHESLQNGEVRNEL